MSSRFVLTAVALAALLAGCAPSRTSTPGADAGAGDPAAAARLAEQSLAWHGWAPVMKAALLVKTKPEQGSPLTFSLSLWSTTDGRIRINLAKLGFDGMDALVKPDGEFDLVLPRSNEAFHGWLYEFLGDHARAERANLALLIEELKRGPLAVGVPYAGEGRTLRFRDPATGLNAVVELDAATPAVKRKTLSDDQGHELAVVTYEKYQVIDDVFHRPLRTTIAFTKGGGTCTLRLEPDKFDVLPSVTDDRMTLRVPDDAKKLSFDQFLDRLGGE